MINIHTAQVKERTGIASLSAYPVDLFPLLGQLYGTDVAGILSNPDSVCRHYRLTMIAQYALVQWNNYCVSNALQDRRAFLAHAAWLAQQAMDFCDNASGWPIFETSCHLSALTQGYGLSVLLRAYQITQDNTLLELAERVVRTFERDILDGGVAAPLEQNGLFFEEVAVYPAAHTLSGCLVALIALHEYVALTGDIPIAKLLQRSLAAVHNLLEEFDAGFWIYTDLLHRDLASPSQLLLQATLLAGLVHYTDCDHCKSLVRRWTGYSQRQGNCLRYHLTSRWISYSRILQQRVQVLLFPRTVSSLSRVCVAVPAFPVMGGVLTVLEGMAQAMQGVWQIEYLTQHLGLHSSSSIIHRFGRSRMTPWYFPFVWLYVLAGIRKFLSVMRCGASYQLVLPQDGVFTGALAGLAGKLTGTRVVCIDHGNISLFTPRNARILRTERINAIATMPRPWFVRLAARQLLCLYWPSCSLLAHISVRLVDHFLIPGVSGDSIEEGCQQLGLDTRRVTRYGSMIDLDRHALPEACERTHLREQHEIAADAIIVALVCRLSPEKGIDIALESITQALVLLAPEVRKRVHLVIAGDGPMRAYVEADIRARGLDDICSLWGDIPAESVSILLSISDIFLYTSMRGACMAMAVLEAMASACAVIASTEPLANAVLLDEGRGIAVPPGDVIQTRDALVLLLSDQARCHQMGTVAREYIRLHHSPASFRQTLLRATGWSAFHEFLEMGVQRVIPAHLEEVDAVRMERGYL